MTQLPWGQTSWSLDAQKESHNFLFLSLHANCQRLLNTIKCLPASFTTVLFMDMNIGITFQNGFVLSPVKSTLLLDTRVSLNRLDIADMRAC